MFIEKPWGHEIIWARTKDYVGKLIHIETGKKLSRQYHVEKDESIYVIKGELTLEIGNGQLKQTLVLKEGQSFRIAPYTIHRFVATVAPVDVIEVSTPQLNDVVRLADEYGRADTEEEALSLLD
jgi:mannose-6-phosphate isomerase